ncbi:MAG TPA: alpha-hydroxy acid oxidase [Candidatus Obscuribacterales bacterium]
MSKLKAEVEPISVFDFEPLAKERLTPMVYDYYASGAWDEITLRANRQEYDRINIMPRMLVDVSRRDMTTEILGQKLSMPIVIAPTAFHALATADGEKATARAAGRAGTIMSLSTLSNTSVEDVTEAATGPVWFQLYVYKDRGITKDLVMRAEACGCKGLVVTVDSPLLGRREKDVRNRFRLPDGFHLGNLTEKMFKDLPADVPDSGLAAYIASLYDASLNWSHIDWFRTLTKLPIIIKGVLRTDDARRAIEHGAAAIAVSNHGGRQVDTAPATITVLREIVEAVDGKVPVIVDGGIRRGTDVLKAIAFGASVVMVGRPILWGLAYDGENGAVRVLDILRQELDLCMALSGCPTLASITPDMVRWAKE